MWRAKKYLDDMYVLELPKHRCKGKADVQNQCYFDVSRDVSGNVFGDVSGCVPVRFLAMSPAMCPAMFPAMFLAMFPAGHKTCTTT